MRTRLIVILLLAAGLVWLSAVAWIHFNTRAEVERVLDARLTEAARMVNSLITDHRIEVAMAAVEPDVMRDFEAGRESYERQLSCQIWSLDGTLVGQSESAPSDRLTQVASGFSETVIDGEPWRVYAVENADLGVRVMVGDNLQVRDSLVNDVITGLMVPAILVLPLMIALIWFAVRQGLNPLQAMAGSLRARPANDLSAIPAEGAPVELQPAIDALNGLFRRVETARSRERGFTAFAAHELKTPLSGLKTQAQIALASHDTDIQRRALGQIVQGVDRTSRLVGQLLDLAALDDETTGAAVSGKSLRGIVEQVVADLHPAAMARTIRIEMSDLKSEIVCAHPALLHLALRNLIENAIVHGKTGGRIDISTAAEAQAVEIVVSDDGPGMDPTDLSRATQRFFRATTATIGSGLGLAIVEAAATRMGGTLRLESARGQGLRAKLAVPAQPTAPSA